MLTVNFNTMSNTFGTLFRITSFGESHGSGVGVVIDGCPSGIELDTAFIQQELNRRKPGQSRITTQRKESDTFELFSGHVNGITTGAPLCFFVANTNARSKDYDHLVQNFRPSHADYTYFAKYGVRDHRGGGRSSARETIARVIGGAVAKQYLTVKNNMIFEAWVHSIQDLELATVPQNISFESEKAKAVRCPDSSLAAQMYERIDRIRKEGDSLGGTIMGRIRNVPAGLGEPIYNKLSASLGAAMLGINAVKGFEIGSGFEGTRMRGSEHNDIFYLDNGIPRTKTNYSGGIQGGISNGEDILFKVAFKPTSTIMQSQPTINAAGEHTNLPAKGRHDPCVVPRAVPIVEAMAAIVMTNFVMENEARK